MSLSVCLFVPESHHWPALLRVFLRGLCFSLCHPPDPGARAPTPSPGSAGPPPPARAAQVPLRAAQSSTAGYILSPRLTSTPAISDFSNSTSEWLGELNTGP